MGDCGKIANVNFILYENRDILAVSKKASQLLALIE